MIQLCKLIGATIILATASHSFANVTVNEIDEHVIIQNEVVRIDFDLQAGTYTGTNLREDVQFFSGARFQLDPGLRQWKMPKTICRFEKIPVNDDFGTGQTLKIYHQPQKSYDPDRILLLTLYDDKPFVVIGWGIKNKFDYSVRVARADVLFGGELFKGQKVDQPKVLRGAAGAEPTFVEDNWEIEALNSAMLTYKDGSKRCTVVAGGLKYKEFIRRVEIIEGFYRGGNDGKYTRNSKGPRQMTLICEDPHGKIVPAHTEWISSDTFYLDFVTTDPFVNLEQYGNAMAAANNAKPNFYDFPTLCGWVVSSRHLGEGRDLNHSAGMVEQLDVAVKKGFLKYSPLAVRVEPDYYCYGNQGDTQQGWWDDEHFARYGSLRKPYETFEKYCTAVIDRGGVPFTYFQCSLPSNDFAVAHPDWMLNNDISQLHVDHAHHRPVVRYDYSDPVFRDHTLKVWQRLAKDGLKGVKFDYPETAWNSVTPFEDKSFTTTSAYRAVFDLCRQGLGPDAFIHERNIGGVTHENFPRNDATAGIVDLQRVWTDASHFEPEMVSRMGLRWYKSRNVFTYYPDSKSMLNNKTKQPLPAHIRRSILSVHALIAGRLELASSFNQMNDEIIHDLTRIYPVIKERRSPRPADMLTGVKHPQVYVYSVTDSWQQVMLINNDKTNEKTISAPLSGDMAETGSLGLSADSQYHVFDFWNQKYLGKLKGSETLSANLKPMETLVCSVRKVLPRPQVLSTNRHIMQGMMELHDVIWDKNTKTLSGKANVIGDEDFIITIAPNGYKSISPDAKNAQTKLNTTADDLVELTITTNENNQVEWSVSFR